jgi:1-acyl-sn-glycerol-3-phosphate acyltransferase
LTAAAAVSHDGSETVIGASCSLLLRMIPEMSIWTLLVFSVMLLVGPWVLMPRRRRDAEIRGLLQFLWGINALICAFWYRLEAEQIAPLPEHGGAILIANHTCPIDSMLLQAASRRVLGFLIAKEYFDYWAFRWICRLLRCIPVRRDGNDLAATRAALRALEQGRVVPMFPEGRILPTSGRELGTPRPGVAFIVLHARVPVIPAYVWGTPETNEFGKALLTPARTGVIFGAPINLAEVAPEGPIDKAALTAVSERLMDSIRALRAQVRGGEAPNLSNRTVEANGPHGPRRPDGAAGAVSSDRPTVHEA